MNFGIRIRDARIAAGLKQSELGKLLGVANTTISNWEKDVTQPSLEMIELLCGALDVSPNAIIGAGQHKTTPTTLSTEQQEYLGKYQALYPEGKERVHTTISFEYAKQFGASQIVTNITPPDEDNESIIYIDFLSYQYDKASAGTGFFLTDETPVPIKVRLDALPKGYERDPSRYCGVTVSGNSMEPKFHDGDILIVKDTTVDMGEIGLVMMNGEGYVKIIGEHVLCSLNPDYEDIPMQRDMRFCGKVVGVLDPEAIK